MKERCLITGGAGFIGSHMIEHFIVNTDWNLVILDGLTYAGDLNRIADSKVDLNRIKFVYHDIRAQLNERIQNEIGNVNFIIHAAAETHVDNSLVNAEPFVYTNVVGTYNMLEFAKRLHEKGVLKKYVQIGTDEVFGPAPAGTNWKEWDRLYPSNPYSATKAGGDCLALAYEKSFGLPVTITRTMNNFGERQHSEKFVPMIIKFILEGRTIRIHGENKDGAWKAGSRKWLHARNHADAVLFLINNMLLPNVADEKIVNVVGNVEVSNLEMVQLIESTMGKVAEWEWMDFHSSRPGHDLRYSLDGKLLFSLGWKPPISFEASMEKAIKWTVNNPKYLV